MAEAGLLVRQDAELRANLDAIGAFAKRRSRPGMVVINLRRPHYHSIQCGQIAANWAAFGTLLCYRRTVIGARDARRT